MVGLKIYGTDELSVGYSFLVIFILTSIIAFFSLMGFLRNWIKFKINVFPTTVLNLTIIIILLLSVPTGGTDATVRTAIFVFLAICIVGIAFTFLAKRPNLGKESNKHIYQAYGAVLEFIVGICIAALGIYWLYIEISQFAGNGTYPADQGFENVYIASDPAIALIYQGLKNSGVILIIAAVIVCLLAVSRNKIGLKIAALGFIAAIIVVLIGLSNFYLNWFALNDQFFLKYPDEYSIQLRLSAEPVGVMPCVVLILLMFLGLFMIIYSSTQDEPLEKWRSKRNHNLAAAEVAIRDQKLPKGIKYLEVAAIFSSRLGEEDAAVELITRINSIKEKAIKMRKAEAADKKKKELDKAKEKAAKQPKVISKALEAKKEGKEEPKED